MSLINDALKRAGEQQSAPAPKPPRQEPKMQPVETKPAPKSPVLFLSIALVVVVVGAIFLLLQWSKTQRNQTVSVPPVAAAEVKKSEVPKPIVPVEKPKIEVEKNPAPIAEVKPVSVPAPEPVAAAGVEAKNAIENSTNETKTAEISAENPTPKPEVVAEAVPAVPTFPTLKLQGIFYTASKPSAIINGKMMLVGGTISGAKVTKIEQERVTVEWEGETRILETAQ